MDAAMMFKIGRRAAILAACLMISLATIAETPMPKTSTPRLGSALDPFHGDRSDCRVGMGVVQGDTFIEDWESSWNFDELQSLSRSRFTNEIGSFDSASPISAELRASAVACV